SLVGGAVDGDLGGDVGEVDLAVVVDAVGVEDHSFILHKSTLFLSFLQFAPAKTGALSLREWGGRRDERGRAPASRAARRTHRAAASPCGHSGECQRGSGPPPFWLGFRRLPILCPPFPLKSAPLGRGQGDGMGVRSSPAISAGQPHFCHYTTGGRWRYRG